MNNLVSGITLVKVFRQLFCVFILMSAGCLHYGSKVNSYNQSIQKDSSIQETAETRINWNVEFSEDFSGFDINSEPESIFILDGEYTVQNEDGNNKCLSLPGSPMGDFGLLFGPREREKPLELSFSFYASKKGRRMPSIAASIGGVRGYKLRLNPAARNLVLSMDETVFKEMPFSWEGEQWWNVRFRALCGNSIQTTRLRCKLWPTNQKEPNEWLVNEEFFTEYIGGKCALWGFPYASTPILFDDLVIRSKSNPYPQ